MKINPFLYAIPALVTLPVAVADISLGRPPAPQAAAEGAYHTDLLASNAVLASLKEIRTVPIVSLESASPTSAQIAVFEVKQNLAYKRYDRMGDPSLQPGKLFPISLAADVPGQDASLGEQIRTMKPGDEAIMNIDHIYIFREDGNENVRACTRFALRKAQGAPQAPSAPTPAQPAAPAATVSTPTPAPAATAAPTHATPLIPMIRLMDGLSDDGHHYSSSVETRIVMQPDDQGVMKRTKIEIRNETIDGKTTVRKFINDVEVDPNTDQPLNPAPSPTEDTPAESPAPAPEKPGDELPPLPDPPADLR